MSVEIMASGGIEEITHSSVASRLKLFEQSGDGLSPPLLTKPKVSPRPHRAKDGLKSVNTSYLSGSETPAIGLTNLLDTKRFSSPQLSPKPAARSVSPSGRLQPGAETPPKPFSAPPSRHGSEESIELLHPSDIKKQHFPHKNVLNDTKAGIDLNSNVNKKPDLPAKPGTRPVLPRKPVPSTVGKHEYKRLSGPPQRPLPPAPSPPKIITNSSDANIVPKPPRGNTGTEGMVNRLEVKSDSQRGKPPSRHCLEEENNEYDAPEDFVDRQTCNDADCERPLSVRRLPPLPKDTNDPQKCIAKPPPIPTSRRPKTAEEQSIYSYACERVIEIAFRKQQLGIMDTYESPSPDSVQGLMQSVNKKHEDSDDDDYDTPDAGSISDFLDRMNEKGCEAEVDATYEAVDGAAVDSFRQSLRDLDRNNSDTDSDEEQYCDPATIPIPKHLLSKKSLPKSPGEKLLPPSPQRYNDSDSGSSDDANEYDDPHEDWGVVPAARRESHAVLNPDAYLVLQELQLNQIYQDPAEMFSNKPAFLEGEDETDLVDEPLYQVYAADVLRNARTQRSQRDSDDDDLWSEYSTSSRESFQRPLWCHLASVRGSGILDTIDTKERKRQEAMFEVITSEASYLKSLHVLVNHFMAAMIPVTDGPPEERILDRHQFHFLFGGLTSIKAISERFLHDLRQKQEESFIISSIGGILQEYASKYFECYVKYCSNQMYQERSLSKLINENPAFGELLGRLESSPKSQGLSLQSFLMLPMQRITRLPLLVDAICQRCEPGSDEFHNTDEALRAINSVVKKCNEDTRKMERIEEMYYIQQTLTFKMKPIALISSSRWLLRRGEITCLEDERKHSKLNTAFKTLLRGGREKQIYFFLFTDLLLLTKKKTEESFKVLDYCSRRFLRVEETEITNLEQRPTSPGVSTKYMFSLILLENHRSKTAEYFCFPQNETDKIRWLDALMPQRESHIEGEKIYEEWDCPQVEALHNYQVGQPDELTLQEGDIVKVLRKLPDGWYEGMRLRDGEQGWFPANHTEEIHSEHARARNLMQRFRLINATKAYMNTLGKQ